MKVLVNASTCVNGGGIQVSAAFIAQAVQEENIDFVFAVSQPIFQNVEGMGLRDARILMVSPSPARPWDGRPARRLLRTIETDFKPDVAFTVFGPAYHRFHSPHVCGYANGWVTHRTQLALSVLPLLRRWYFLAWCRYQQMWLSKKDWYWVEADVARRGLVRLLGIDAARIKVIPNAYAGVFDRVHAELPAARNLDGITKIFVLSASYPHKNLTLIPDVAQQLKSRAKESAYQFVITLPEEGELIRQIWEKAEQLDVKSMIINAGELKLHECPAWYAQTDMLFLPTLLETFSATYLEAMVMGKPIVTTDLDFAHDICSDAAVYFTPLSAVSAADAIRRVARDQELRAALIRNGKRRVRDFPTPKEKYQLLIEWLREVVKRENTK